MQVEVTGDSDLMMVKPNLVWNCTGLEELFLEKSEKKEIIIRKEDKWVGYICQEYLQPKNMHTWKLYMIEAFQFQNH